MLGETVAAHRLSSPARSRYCSRMSSKASLASLRHDPDELVAAAPQVHLVDDHVGAPIRRGRRDDQVQSVAALDPDIEPEPGGHLDAQLRQCRVRVAGECGIAPGKYREGLLELGGIEWAHGIPGHSASVHIVRHRVVVLNCDHATASAAIGHNVPEVPATGRTGPQRGAGAVRRAQLTGRMSREVEWTVLRLLVPTGA